jgi:hypothetical protein
MRRILFLTNSGSVATLAAIRRSLITCAFVT